MKTCHLIACATLLIHSAFPLDAAVPVIANLTAAQRTGTNLVETPTTARRAAGTQAGPTKTPVGMNDSDWSGIRGAYERNRHAIVANQDGSHQARNPGQAWLTRFDGRGFTLTPDAGGWSWGLELVGCGEVTQVRKDGGRISYVRGEGLTEWFVNDSRGLEQGWTLAKRPERMGASGDFHLDLAVRGGLRPDIAAAGGSVVFVNDVGTVAVIYGGLKAWDADGKYVPVRFEAGEAGSSGFRVAVDDRGAVYPITIDPVAQQAYLKASNTDAGDDFGNPVAISGDTVVVGAELEDSNASGVNGNQADNSTADSGAVYVFVRTGTSWSQQAYLKASNPGAGDFFGTSVAISGDTLVVGAIYERSNASGVNGNQADDSVSMAGAAYVFVRSGTSWSQQAYLKASNTAAEDQFGMTVSVSGETIVVGAIWEDSAASGINGNQADNSASNAGAAYVFVRNGVLWSQQAYLKASNTDARDRFGWSVALSDNTLVVGAKWEDSYATGVNGSQSNNSADASGAAYVFFRIGTTWTQQAYLKASNTGPGDEFGYLVAVSGDTVVVGAWLEDSVSTGVNGNQSSNTATDSGAAYVFVRNGTTWSQQAYLKGSNTEASDYFGYSFAVSGDMLIVGAFGEDSSATEHNGNQADNSAANAGAAYVFVRSGITWSQQAYLKASNTGSEDHFGASVAVSGDTVVVGADWEDSNAIGVNGNQADNSTADSGAVYVFANLVSLSASSVHGSVDGAGVYNVGAIATLTATPVPGYTFTGWTGDATGTANPLSLAMDTPKSVTANFAPDALDDDADGLTNYQEIVVYGTNPTMPDSDGDGVNDSKDDLPLDPAETLDTDGDGVGDNADTDDDGDGYSDVDEITIHHTNPKRADSDGDGLTDPAEIQTHHTDPNIADTDNDGLRDGEEFTIYHTNPLVGDTDGDGFLDGYEVFTGKLPLDPLDKPGLVAEARTAIEFTFPAAIGKTYRIEASMDLATWEIVESGIAGNGSQVQRFYSTRGQPKRYFRVELENP